mmetsp:Transcript_37649/g.100429  ORF Transcript_37649/g.100429 Transcript_37649/m.100429 type:complete len:337 (-) Transcript_37649:510-1520(-)
MILTFQPNVSVGAGIAQALCWALGEEPLTRQSIGGKRGSPRHRRLQGLLGRDLQHRLCDLLRHVFDRLVGHAPRSGHRLVHLLFHARLVDEVASERLHYVDIFALIRDVHHFGRQGRKRRVANLLVASQNIAPPLAAKRRRLTPRCVPHAVGPVASHRTPTRDVLNQQRLLLASQVVCVVELVSQRLVQLWPIGVHVGTQNRHAIGRQGHLVPANLATGVFASLEVSADVAKITGHSLRPHHACINGDQLHSLCALQLREVLWEVRHLQRGAGQVHDALHVPRHMLGEVRATPRVEVRDAARVGGVACEVLELRLPLGRSVVREGLDSPQDFLGPE